MKTNISLSTGVTEQQVNQLLDFLGLGKPKVLSKLSSSASFVQYAAHFGKLSMPQAKQLAKKLKATVAEGHFSNYVSEKNSSMWVSAPYAPTTGLQLEILVDWGTVLVGFDTSKAPAPYVRTAIQEANS